MKSPKLHILALACLAATLTLNTQAFAQQNAAIPAQQDYLDGKFVSQPSSLGESMKALSHAGNGAVATPQDVTGFTVQDFKCQQITGEVHLSWIALNELGIKEYVVERSTDGKTFTHIGIVPSVAADEDQIYGIVDSKPLNGFTYYCLTSVSEDGNRVCWGFATNRMERDPWLRVWPNPSSTQGVNMEVQFLNDPYLSWRILDVQGGLVREARHVEVVDGSWRMHLGGETETLDRGTYVLQVVGTSQAFSHAFVVY